MTLCSNRIIFVDVDYKISFLFLNEIRLFIQSLYDFKNAQILSIIFKFSIKFVSNELFLVENFEIEINFIVIIFKFEITLNREFDTSSSSTTKSSNTLFVRRVLEQD